VRQRVARVHVDERLICEAPLLALLRSVEEHEQTVDKGESISFERFGVGPDCSIELAVRSFTGGP
jgi:hypothetical protein